MEGGGHEPNELDRLIRSLGNEHVPAGSQREQEAQLFVTPPLREVVHEPFESMMMLQRQQLVPPRFTDEFLNPLAVPSPTAEWVNFMSMTNNDPLQGPAYSSAAAAAASASAFATTSSTGGFLTFQQLQRDLLSSDSAAAHDFANSAWDFVENQITPEIGNFPAGNNSEPLNLDAIQELLNTTMISGSNPHLTGSRTPQFLMAATHQSSGHHQHQHQLAGDSDFYNQIRRASPPQSQFHSPSPPSSVGSVSPVQTSRSLSTHGGRRSPSLARLPNSAGSTLGIASRECLKKKMAKIKQKGNDHHQQISNNENPSGSRRVSLSAFGSDDYVQQQKQLSTVEACDTSENCFQIGLPQLEYDSILIVGRKRTFEGVDAIEFLFEQVEDMSKVVGVGLQRSKVVVTEQFGVMVIQINEHMWLDLWKETSFVPMSINVPKLPINYKLPMCNLTPEESSKRFGVGLRGFKSKGLCMYVEDNISKQTGEMFPLIFELAEKMGLKNENVKPSWLQHLKDVSTETMEGKVSDQGGSSNEPMDGGDHDQRATSHEPTEGAVSNQGDTSSEHMELGGQVDQQSFGGNPLQLLSESPSGRRPIVSEKNGSLTVIVIPECGGTFHKGLTKELAEPDGRIKSATIAPWLKFKFEKLGDSRKITTTTVTQCNLGGAQLKYHEDLDLGYYHDNITISLTCEENLAARLLSGTVTSIDLTKSSMTETFTGSRSLANQMSGQANVQVQIPLVGVGMQAQGNLGVIDTFGDSRAIAATMESSNTQFAGFLVNPNECPCSLNFNFLYHVEIMEEIVKGHRQFMHAGINKTLWPTIVGEWVPLDWEEACLYKFKTERDITSIGSLRRSSAKGEMPMFMQQRYEVSMFINHAMNHIHRYGTTELRERGVQSLPEVLTKFPAN